MTDMSSGASYAAILVLLLLLLMFGSAVLLIVLGLTGRRKASMDGGACGACGYSVRGLEALRCPECGADLREAGILRAGHRSTGRNVMLVSGVLLAFLLFFCVLSTFFLGAAPRSSHPPPPVHLQPSPTTPAPPGQTQPVSPTPAPSP